MNSNDRPVRSARLCLPVRDLMRLKVNGVTMVIAPETASPYAPANAAELPNPITSASEAAIRIQFMAGTWAGTPWANQSRTDPVANAQAAAWLYNRYGPGRWTCQ